MLCPALLLLCMWACSTVCVWACLLWVWLRVCGRTVTFQACSLIFQIVLGTRSPTHPDACSPCAHLTLTHPDTCSPSVHLTLTHPHAHPLHILRITDHAHARNAAGAVRCCCDGCVPGPHDVLVHVGCDICNARRPHHHSRHGPTALVAVQGKALDHTYWPVLDCILSTYSLDLGPAR